MTTCSAQRFAPELSNNADEMDDRRDIVRSMTYASFAGRNEQQAWRQNCNF